MREFTHSTRNIPGQRKLEAGLDKRNTDRAPFQNPRHRPPFSGPEGSPRSWSIGWLGPVVKSNVWCARAEAARQFSQRSV